MDKELVPLLCIVGVVFVACAWASKRRTGAQAPSALPWVLCRLTMIAGVAGVVLAGLAFVLPYWGLAVAVIIFAAVRRAGRWRGGGTSGGVSRWATAADLAPRGMLGGSGLMVGRLPSAPNSGYREGLDALFAAPWSRSKDACAAFAAGRRGGGGLVRVNDYTHAALIGPTGGGKGVSFIVPWLKTYTRGSVVVFDPKGDLFELTATARRAMGNRVARLAPFSEGSDRFNPLDGIAPDSRLLVDEARAISEALVVRTGTEPDPHWNESAVVVICAVIVLVLMCSTGKERSLNFVRDILSDSDTLDGAALELRKIGGVVARLGNQILSLKDKERAGVLSTASRHLSFLDSVPVADSLASGTFDPAWLLEGAPTTVYLSIPPWALEAQRGLLRLWVSSLVRSVGRSGDERAREVLFLLDEASALGGLAAIEEALVRGRSSGARLVLVYQSDSQVKAAFPQKETIIFDNTATQIYLGATGFETAERVSNMLGQWTQVVESFSPSSSRSRNEGGQHGGGQVQAGVSRSFSEQPRLLLRPEEVLRLPPDQVIVFHRGTPPLLLRRVRYFDDPAVAAGGACGDEGRRAWGVAVGWLLAGCVALFAAAVWLGIAR